MTGAPILETERLRLRPHRLEDYPASAAMWADPLTVRYIREQPFTAEESWSRLLRYAGHWRLLAFGYWALTDKLTGDFVGEAGFADYHRAIDPPLHDIPEIGWTLAPHLHGRGLASEAVRAIIAWGDANLAADRTACIIHPENAPSIRIAEKNSYRESQRTNYAGHPASVFFRPRVTA